MTTREQAIEAMMLLDAARCGRALRHHAEKLLDTITALLDERIAHALAEVGKITPSASADGSAGPQQSVEGGAGQAGRPSQPHAQGDCGTVRLHESASPAPAPASGGEERRWWIGLDVDGPIAFATERDATSAYPDVIPVVPASRAEAAETRRDELADVLACISMVVHADPHFTVDAVKREVARADAAEARAASAERERDAAIRQHEEARRYIGAQAGCGHLVQTAKRLVNERDAALARVRELEEQVCRYETTQPMRAEQAAHSMKSDHGCGMVDAAEDIEDATAKRIAEALHSDRCPIIGGTADIQRVGEWMIRGDWRKPDAGSR